MWRKCLLVKIHFANENGNDCKNNGTVSRLYLEIHSKFDKFNLISIGNTFYIKRKIFRHAQNCGYINNNITT